MSNEWDQASNTDDLDEGQSNPGKGKGLREYAEAQRAENEKLKADMAKLSEEIRQGHITKALEAKGLDPKVARLVPADVATDGLDKWVEEYGDLFGGASTSSPEPQQDPSSPPEPEPFDAYQQQMDRMGSAIRGGKTPDPGGTELLSKIANTTDMKELDELIRSSRTPLG